MNLFNYGDFTLHSGQQSNLKIDCDALTDSDWASIANIVADRIGHFSEVEGVPTGGLKLAAALSVLRWVDGPLLIVDDVLTTGASMEDQRAGRDAIGVVLFARSDGCPDWVTPVFRMEMKP